VAPGRNWINLLSVRGLVKRSRDEIRLWRDAALGETGVELLACRCFEHRYRPHFHDELAIVAFTDGAQKHSIGRHRGVALPGNVMIIPPGEMHTAEAAEDCGWSYRAFYLDSTTVAAIAADLFCGKHHPLLEFGTNPLHENASLCRRLTSLHHLIETNLADPLARQQAFADAIEAVLLRYAQPSRLPRGAPPERRAVCRAIEYANANFSDPALATADLAAAACLSPYHFMRSFRATTGVTVHGFVVQLRIQQARRLLARGWTATAVAHAVGFTDQSHLIRHFRAALGVTPGQYAKETRMRTCTGRLGNLTSGHPTVGVSTFELTD
jgi:AraC-like DNA-binding protein